MPLITIKMRKTIIRNIQELFRTSKRTYKVTVVGGASEIGQTLCLLLRSEPTVSKLVVHDNRGHTPGVVMDLSHVPSETRIQGYTGEDTLATALKNADIVIGTGGVMRKPGITEHLWLSENIKFVKTLAMQVATMEPMPFVGIVTEPINSIIPIVAEVLKNHGDYDSKKLFGITGLDTLRAQTLFASQNKFNPKHCWVPVIGGRSQKTVIPLLSHSQPVSIFDAKMTQEFTLKFRQFDDELLTAKRGVSPTLSVAYSALLFTRSVLEALGGRQTKVNAFIENNDFGTEYFGGLVHINNKGVKEMERFTSLSLYELELLERCFQELRRDALKGKKVLEFC